MLTNMTDDQLKPSLSSQVSMLNLQSVDMWLAYAVTGVATGQKAKNSSGRMKQSEMILTARP